MKNMSKRILSVMLAVVLVLGSAPLSGFAGLEFPDFFECSVKAVDSEKFIEGLYAYTVTDNEATIVDCDESASGDIVIPSTLGGYTVTAIGKFTFGDNISITSVVIPEGVTTIGEMAFYGCKNINKIVFPSSLELIRKEAFGHCYRLKSILISGNIKTIEQNAFAFCSRLEDITILGNGETEIGEKCFYYCDQITNVRLCVKEIGFQAINGAEIQTLKLEEGLEEIGERNFCINTKLTEVIFPDSLKIIGNNVFTNNEAIESITFGKNLITLGHGAFRKCNKLEKVHIDCENIDGRAFENSASLTEVTFSERVETIAENAFNGCTSKLTFIDKCGTVAHKLALKKNIKFISLQHQIVKFDQFVIEDENKAVYHIGTRCKYCLGEVVITSEHYSTSWNILSEPTCTSEGIKQYVFEDLGRTYNVSMEMLPHTPEVVPAVKATCTQSGLTEGSVCSDCGKVFVSQRFVSMIPHNYELVEEVKKTCTTSGYERYACSMCGLEKVITTEASHDFEIIKVVKPTCYKTGYTRYACTACGEEKVGDKTNLTAHKSSLWITVTPPTVTEEGLKVIECTVCGEILQEKAIEKLAYVFEIKSDSVTLDKTKEFIFGFDKGVENLEEYFDFEGCELEITPTENGNGTGTVITVTDEGKVIKKYTVIVFGDITGDGVIDAFDTSIVNSISNFESEVKKGSVYELAGDLNGDGYIDIYDSALMNAAMNFEYEIPQTM